MSRKPESEIIHAIDAITVELVKNALNGIAQEMQTTLERTAHSQMIREVGDASSAIFDPTGRMIAQAVSMPVQLAGSTVSRGAGDGIPASGRAL